MTSQYQLDNDSELDLEEDEPDFGNEQDMSDILGSMQPPAELRQEASEFDLEDYVPDSDDEQDIRDILDSIKPPPELRQEAKERTSLELQNSANYRPYDPSGWDEIDEEDLEKLMQEAEAEALEKLRQEALVKGETGILPHTNVVIDVEPIGKSQEGEENVEERHAERLSLQQEVEANVEERHAERVRLQEGVEGNVERDRLRSEINLQADLSILSKVYLVISLGFFLAGFFLILSSFNSGDREIRYMGVILWTFSIIILCCIPVLRNIFTYFSYMR